MKNQKLKENAGKMQFFFVCTFNSFFVKFAPD